MSSMSTAEAPVICNIPVDAECFDASGFIEEIPPKGEQRVLASFQLHPQYCGVLTHFAQFTDRYAASPVNIDTPGLEWIILQNGKPVFPYIRLEMIVNPWGCNCLPVLIRLDENSKIEFLVRNVDSKTSIHKVAGRIMGRYWYNAAFGGR
ncbi:MAG TPA: hypothetical protein VGJ66_15265 [Pyrinomonadaceae bacterium]|jgi:hypothetical protein